jgi:hypothetical protein
MLLRVTLDEEASLYLQSTQQHDNNPLASMLLRVTLDEEKLACTCRGHATTLCPSSN